VYLGAAATLAHGLLGAAVTLVGIFMPGILVLARTPSGKRAPFWALDM
jgi:hypothetical protein